MPRRKARECVSLLEEHTARTGQDVSCQGAGMSRERRAGAGGERERERERERGEGGESKTERESDIL